VQGEIGKPLAVMNEIAPDLSQAIVCGEVGQRQVTLALQRFRMSLAFTASPIRPK
jgi:hypothetical protein